MASALLPIVIVLGFAGCAHTPPPAAQKPSGAKKPVSAQKPANLNKPVAAQKPVPAQKPIASKKPIVVQKPVAPQKPVAVQKPVNDGPLQAGLAEIDVTPPVGYRLSGYFDERFSKGTHDPLKARAIVLQQGPCEVALVFCDQVGLSLDVTRAARAQASQATHIPVTNIVIASTYGCTGPLFDDLRRDYFHQYAMARHGRDSHEMTDYPAFLTRQLVQVIAQARTNLQPAALGARIAAQSGMPFNSRYQMKDGRVTSNPGPLNPDITGPAGPVDSDLGILLVKDTKSAELVGGLTVFSMRSDTVGGLLFSADYPYFVQQALRKVFGNNYVSAFGAGACGDLDDIDVSKEGQGRGFEAAQKLGEGIGQTIIATLPELYPLDKPAVAVRSTTLVLPLQTVTPRQLAEASVILDRLRDPRIDVNLKARAVRIKDLARRGSNWPVEIQVFRLNSDNAIVCLPGEMFAEFGMAIKRASPFSQTMVISMCNDRLGYVPTPKAFKEGGYEVIDSRLKPGAGETMVATAIKMLEDLKPGK